MFSKILILSLFSSVACAHSGHQTRGHAQQHELHQHVQHHNNFTVWELRHGHWVQIYYTRVWVPAHHRHGRHVPGHWKKVERKR